MTDTATCTARGSRSPGGYAHTTTMITTTAAPPAPPVRLVPAGVSAAGAPQALETAGSKRPGWRSLRRAVRLLTTVAMLLLVATFTAVAAMPAVDARAMIVLSGSMEPLVSAGDAAIIRDVPVEELRVGDVITYHGIGGSKGLTTHRIVRLMPLESGLHFQTQGDANSAPDPDLAPAANVVGRYDGMIPHGGRALMLLSKPEAKVLLVALPALLMLIGELRTLAAALTARIRDGRGPARSRLVLAGLTLMLAAAVGVTATAATMAVLTDTVTVGDSTFATAEAF